MTFLRSFILLCLFTLSCCVSDLSYKDKTATPEGVVQNYLIAVQGDDINTMKEYYPDISRTDVVSNKPCVSRLRRITMENTKWNVSKANLSQEKHSQLEVAFEEPALENYIQSITQKELSNAANFSSNNSFENQLCENIAESMAHTTKKKIASFGVKKTKQCFSLEMNENVDHWIITGQTYSACKDRTF